MQRFVSFFICAAPLPMVDRAHDVHPPASITASATWATPVTAIATWSSVPLTVPGVRAALDLDMARKKCAGRPVCWMADAVIEAHPPARVRGAGRARGGRRALLVASAATRPHAAIRRTTS